jgi:hypothetical protein
MLALILTCICVLDLFSLLASYMRGELHAVGAVASCWSRVVRVRGRRARGRRMRIRLQRGVRAPSI